MRSPGWVLLRPWASAIISGHGQGMSGPSRYALTLWERRAFSRARRVGSGGFIFLVLLWMASLGGTPPQAADPQVTQPGLSPTFPTDSTGTDRDGEARYSALVKQYCMACHRAGGNPSAIASGVVFDAVNLQQVASNPDLWEKVVRKLRAGAMPPPGTPHPEVASLNGFVTWLEARLDRAPSSPYAGRPVLHRLNRTEYANAIRDLLMLDVGDVSALLPPDDSSYGFDTIADFLGVSQVLLERYLSAADWVSATAVGDTELAPGSQTYTVRQDLSQDKHIEGMPFGTVGGVLARHVFPVDGEYILQATLYRTNVDQTRGLEHLHQLEMTVDGERVFLIGLGGAPPGNPGGTDEAATGRGRLLSRSDAIDARLQVRVPVKAGQHPVTAAFLQKSRAAGADKLQPYRSSYDTYDSSGFPHIETLVIKGPFAIQAAGNTASRARIFTCRPRAAAQEEKCATEILSTIARRAYRQPPSKQDVERLLAFYRMGRKDATFEKGIQLALQRILASPKFVLRVERDPANVAEGAAYRISDYELATRLSFFLWSSIPDDELLRLADEGRFRDPAVLESQVRRMLADHRSSALVENFAGQWLQLRNLQRVTPDNDRFPMFDDNLRQSFRREVELLFESVMHEDRSVLDLLTADYTFVNERLARHYGIPNVYGDHFRRVALADEARKGLLGKGAMLLVTSNADRTSPVVRGKWILDNLLGMPPPAPPANVPPLEATGDGGRVLTMREQMEAHRKSPVCASCHKLMDPFGFALENFDAVGAWRTQDAGTPIDATSTLLDGTHVDGVVELRQAILKRQEIVVGTMVEKLLTYGLGRGLDARDMPAVRGIAHQMAQQNNRFSSLVAGVVTSVPFQMRTKVSGEDAPVATHAQQ